MLVDNSVSPLSQGEKKKKTEKSISGFAMSIVDIESNGEQITLGCKNEQTKSIEARDIKNKHVLKENKHLDHHI